MLHIKNITGRKILNSAGQWTLETRLELKSGTVARASVPQGLSKGPTEAAYLPVNLAIQKLHDLQTQLKNLSFSSLAAFDNELIAKAGETKHLLGANTTLSLSIAFARAAAQEARQELYVYLAREFNLPQVVKMPALMVLGFEGGDHAVNGIHIQEILMIADSVETGKRYYHLLQDKLATLGHSTAVGTEGGFCPPSINAEQAVTMVADISPMIGLDVAAHNHPAAIQEYLQLSQHHTFFSVEDPFELSDNQAWQALVAKQQSLVIADDLTTTNAKLIHTAATQKMANAVIIKPNQAGTITESIFAVDQARKEGWKIICSHRGHETNDDFIADFACAVQSDFVKFGGFSKGERIAKYNRLITIRSMV